ncbi:MAG: M20/M25/M40 family metallo-hydrolase [Bryobacteraceae bacterium]
MKYASLVCLFAATVVCRAESLTNTYRETADKLIAAAKADDEGWRRLMYLCDRIGNRLSGSASLERAIVWAAAEMKAAGLENVVTPPVKVPHWVRGSESATLIAPEHRALAMLGLGNSVGTPPEGITAEVVSVGSFEELEKLGRAKVEGRIVLYNVPYAGYGRTVQFRIAGASHAAALGAVGMLLRSVGPVSLSTPHTGVMDYSANAPKIPAAALSIEGATQIARLIEAGNTVKVQLKMEAQMLPDADSANVIGEIRGREKPDEIVVLGGHYDSWDVGQGAHDDGASCIAAFQALALMKKLGLQPRRTVRVAFWVNEENGGAGGRGYYDWAGASVKKHVAAIEMDGGSEKPLGFGFSMPGSPEVQGKAQAHVAEIGALLAGIEAGSITRGGGGADISPLMRDGVPGLGLRTVGTRYFEWHHTNADTLDKIDKNDFRLNIATLAVMSYVLADMPGGLAE